MGRKRVSKALQPKGKAKKPKLEIGREVGGEIDREVGGAGESGSDDGDLSDGGSDLGSGAGGVLEKDDVETSVSDPFVFHFERDLGKQEAEDLSNIFSEPLKYHHSVDPILCGVSEARFLPSRTFDITDVSKTQLYVKRKLALQLREASAAGEGDGSSAAAAASASTSETHFSPLQAELFAIVSSYKDLMFSRRTFENGEDIRKVYLLHALNHVLKTRSRILKNNARLALASKGKEMEEPRDQGLTRPKVLILVPFREAALRTVNMIIELLLPQGQGEVNNRKRFFEEYKEEDHIQNKVKKPASYESMFAGNIDDCFRLGIAVRRNRIKLYSQFYSSDIIVASPLGLRTVIGAKGDKERDFDFLSSLELVILDQADVYLMQNWDHVLHLFDHTHLQPRESHGVDFSRVRMWSINGWSQFYRQTLVFSAFETPEINSLFGTRCKNFGGRVKVSETVCSGSISRVAVQVSHVFHRFPCSSPTQLPKTRFNYFVERILPDLTGDLMRQTCILVPSYLDFIHLRNHMIKQEVELVELCEYTKSSDVSRGRTKFFHGGAQILLYTERVHFFRRFVIRGVRHIVFYCLPNYSEFYLELVNLLGELARVGGVTCTVLYSSYDSLALCRIVGSRQAQTMMKAQDSIYTIVAGETL